MGNRLSRRGFLRAGLAGAGVAAVGGCATNIQSASPPSGAHSYGDANLQQASGGDCGTDYAILRRNLGRTGESVSILGIGGQRMAPADAPDIVNAALDAGINYFDTGRMYGWQGANEQSWGPVVAERRDEMFLVSSFDSRTESAVLTDLDASLAALQTDHLDAYLVHMALSGDDVSDGVIQAWEAAKSDGRIRFTGVACHEFGDDAYVACLGRYDFDIMRLPTSMDYNYRGPHVLGVETGPILAERNCGVVGMKVLANGTVWGEFPSKTLAEVITHVWDTYPIHSAILGVTTLQQLQDDIAIAEAYTQALFA